MKGRLVIARDWRWRRGWGDWERMAKGCDILGTMNENILKMMVVVNARFCEYASTKSH